jgi:hypothetical protein
MLARLCTLSGSLLCICNLPGWLYYVWSLVGYTGYLGFIFILVLMAGYTGYFVWLAMLADFLYLLGGWI